MRFRYFDATGEEVRLSSVDALKFRINTGAVTTETLLYDAAVDQWAPAEEHAVFRFLTEEDMAADVGSGGKPVEGASIAETERSHNRSSASSTRPSQDGSSTSTSPRLRPGEGNVVLSLDEESPAQKSTWQKESKERGRTRDAGRAPTYRWKSISRSRSARRSTRSAGTSGQSRKGFEITARRVGAATILLAAAVVAVLLVRGGGEEDGAALAVAGDLNGFLSTEPAPDAGDVAGMVESDRGAGDAMSEDATTPASVALPLNAPSETRRDELAAEVAAAATGDLELALMDLKLALDVPDRPPVIWLQGRYLAAADSFPGVRTYWQSVAAYVTAMQELDEDLYRGFVESRVLRMRLDTTSAADISARALERYQRTADQRTETFRTLTELTGLALQLHDVLALRSEDIAYEPFDSRTLSRDPVVEAVADDPELAQEIWNDLDGIFIRLEDLQGLGPVSTALLQDAVLRELRAEEGGA